MAEIVNVEIARRPEEVAQLLQEQGAHPYRVHAPIKSQRIIRGREADCIRYYEAQRAEVRSTQQAATGEGSERCPGGVESWRSTN